MFLLLGLDAFTGAICCIEDEADIDEELDGERADVVFVLFV